MIQITIYRKQTTHDITAFQVSGHANYAEHGQDIVCAAVSAITFGTIQAVYKLIEYEPEIDKKDSGWLRALFPKPEHAASEHQLQLLLEAMTVMLESIQDSYEDYVKIQIIHE